MKRLQIIGITAAAIVSLSAGNNLCFEYPSSRIELTHITMEITDPDDSREVHEKVDPAPYRLLMARASRPNKLNWHYLYLVRKHGNRIITSQSLECNPKKGFAGGFKCHGECDSGGADFDRRDNLILTSENILLGESIDLPEGEWEMAAKNRDALLPATPVPCLPEIEKQNLAPDDSVADSYVEQVKREENRPAHYVCYSAKTIQSINGEPRPRYEGCQVSKDACKEIGLLHFGHYNSDLATNEAMIRCRKSTPKATTP